MTKLEQLKKPGHSSCCISGFKVKVEIGTLGGAHKTSTKVWYLYWSGSLSKVFLSDPGVPGVALFDIYRYRISIVDISTLLKNINIDMVIFENIDID